MNIISKIVAYYFLLEFVFVAIFLLEGRITTEIKGEEGFGYDPIFYVRHLGKTVAQLSSREKNAISHRGEAVRRLVEFIKTGLTG